MTGQQLIGGKGGQGDEPHVNSQRLEDLFELCQNFLVDVGGDDMVPAGLGLLLNEAHLGIVDIVGDRLP